MLLVAMEGRELAHVQTPLHSTCFPILQWLSDVRDARGRFCDDIEGSFQGQASSETMGVHYTVAIFEGVASLLRF